jgi:hypothetical protein
MSNQSPPEQETLAMAAIATLVGLGATVAPGPFLRLFGIREEPSPAATLAWRLFAVRNFAVAAAAVRGEPAARDMFLPVQIADQVAWWQLYRSGRLSLRATAMAAAASGAIIALDLRRRARS